MTGHWRNAGTSTAGNNFFLLRRVPSDFFETPELTLISCLPHNQRIPRLLKSLLVHGWITLEQNAPGCVLIGQIAILHQSEQPEDAIDKKRDTRNFYCLGIHLFNELCLVAGIIHRPVHRFNKNESERE